MNAPPLLRAIALARRYGPVGASVGALAETSVAIEAGEIVAIVGANGSGKSTLLRALADVVHGPGASGAVELDGRRLSRADAARMRAFVPQRPDVAADFTAQEVVQLGRFARGADDEAVARALAAVGLAARSDRSMRVLSGGERQRVAVARALAQIDGAARAVLLLDEPFGGIDPAEVARIVATLRSFASRGAVVLSLHDPGLARQVATRAIVLAGGRVVADGPTRETLTTTVLSAAYGHPMVESTGWLAPDLEAGCTLRA